MAKKQQSFSEVFLVDQTRISHEAVRSTISAIETGILFTTSAVAVALPSLPYEQVDGNRVPTIIFKGMPCTFHAFLISVMFAFSGAFSALFAHNRPKIARFCRYYSALSMVSAVALLIYASFSQPS